MRDCSVRSRLWSLCCAVALPFRIPQRTSFAPHLGRRSRWSLAGLRSLSCFSHLFASLLISSNLFSSFLISSHLISSHPFSLSFFFFFFLFMSEKGQRRLTTTEGKMTKRLQIILTFSSLSLACFFFCLCRIFFSFPFFRVCWLSDVFSVSLTCASYALALLGSSGRDGVHLGHRDGVRVAEAQR